MWTPIIGYSQYPLPGGSYTLKDWLGRRQVGRSGTTLVVELQGEPWVDPRGVFATPCDEEVRQFPPEQLIEANLEHASEPDSSRSMGGTSSGGTGWKPRATPSTSSQLAGCSRWRITQGFSKSAISRARGDRFDGCSSGARASTT